MNANAKQGRRVRGALIALVVFAGLLGGCRSASIDERTVAKVNQTEPTVQATEALPAAPVLGSTDYRVGPLDVLEIQVYGVEDLTTTVRVSEGGEFTLPLIGRVPGAGRTVSELELDIAERLSVQYLENPQVTVFVKEYQSQRVTIEGAVRKPGIIALTGRTSLLQIIALSEGLDDMANPGGIVVYRVIEGRRHAAAFDIREIRAGRLIDPEIVGNDIVVVDYSGARSGIRDFLSTVPALALFLVL